MADETTYYTLVVDGNSYRVTCKGRTCTIEVPEDFFSPKPRGERHNQWKERATGPLFKDLGNIYKIRAPEFHTAYKVVLVMNHAGDWGGIVNAVKDAFRAHLKRKEKGEYEG